MDGQKPKKKKSVVRVLRIVGLTFFALYTFFGLLASILLIVMAVKGVGFSKEVFILYRVASPFGVFFLPIFEALFFSTSVGMTGLLLLVLSVILTVAWIRVFRRNDKHFIVPIIITSADVILSFTVNAKETLKGGASEFIPFCVIPTVIKIVIIVVYIILMKRGAKKRRKPAVPAAPAAPNGEETQK